jgi:uncharacterized membrane protein
MNDFQKSLAEQKVDEIIGRVLRVGVLISGAFVLLGGIIYLIRYGLQFPDYHLFQGEPDNLRTISGIITGILTFRPQGIIQFGILILIATPIARVAFSIYAFARQRDSVYVIITLVVLTALIFSFTGGHF